MKYLLLLFGLFTILISAANSEYNKTFVPTKEWQEIKEGKTSSSFTHQKNFINLSILI